MIRVHEEGAVLTLDVAGPATMMESPAVQTYANERLLRGIRAIRVDLRDCTTMDSTFSGTLLALKRQLAPLGGSFTLVSPSAKVCELLNQMGLVDFYDVALAERVEGAWREITSCTPRVDQLRRLVLDAHDELARVPGPAGRTFRAVADELRRCDPDGRRSDADGRRSSDPGIPSSRT
jgi:anti-anti-sigma factor